MAIYRLRSARCLLFKKRLQLEKRHFKRGGRTVIALALAGLVLLLNAMAASPSLHEWFHADAGKADHQCAVTMFAHGKVDTASVEVPVFVPAALVETIPSVIISAFSPAIDNLPAGRAPPVLPAVS